MTANHAIAATAAAKWLDQEISQRERYSPLCILIGRAVQDTGREFSEIRGSTVEFVRQAILALVVILLRQTTRRLTVNYCQTRTRHEDSMYLHVDAENN